MKNIIIILAMIFFISDCSADARILEQLRAQSKANAKAKSSAAKIKKPKSKVKVKVKVKHESCIVKITKPKEAVTKKDLDIKNDLAYLPDESEPFTGKHELYHSNGKKYIETNYKNGKKNGALIMWDEYEHKVGQLSYLDGEAIDYPD